MSLQSSKRARRRTWGTIGQSASPPSPEKVMEQFVLEVIFRLIEEKKIIRSSQHGFIKGRSCLTNLIAFYDGMSGWVDEGRPVDVVYLDFSKASDAVSYNILIGKLRKCGLDE